MNAHASDARFSSVTRRAFLQTAGKAVCTLPLLSSVLSRPAAACDTLVALPAGTNGGQMIFAKNSDRPQDECQPLVLQPRRTYPAGSVFRAQFVEIPQVATTYRHIGSRPYWCSGYEHGFNEHQVAIGNEALPSKVPSVNDPRLVGMEVLRLALERASSSAAAVEVITDLVEKHGQGKFANAAGVGTYDNIYLCADPREAYVIECAGHDWAVRKVSPAIGYGTISNIGLIGKDADRISASARRNAAAQGLAPVGDGADFDWAATFCRPASGGGANGYVRQRRSAALLAKAAGRIDVRTMIDTLCDHSDGAQPDEPWAGDVRGPISVCMHRPKEMLNAEDSRLPKYPGSTTASLVADLCADGSRLPVYWCGLYSPCMTLFLPVFIEGELPRALTLGGEKPSDDSPWWMFHRLTHDGLQHGPARRAEIRAAWKPLQAELFETAGMMAQRGREMIAGGQEKQVSAMLTRFMAENASRMLDRGRSLLRGSVAVQ